jgi:hypothetical protein
MSTLHPHVGHDDDAAPVVITDDQRSALERENQLRATVKALEGALRCAAKLLRPYADRAMR